MKVELRLPNLDLPGAAIIATCWHAQVGQRVIEGDRLLEVLAGDTIVDLPAPASGKLIERAVQVDDTLHTGQVLAIIEADEE
jgi:pyruvate/2-oxoglutarate dehydrogenase complex dihydrolipoamide acyltransferase (E2) component